jgi:hypothetical protein
MGYIKVDRILPSLWGGFYYYIPVLPSGLYYYIPVLPSGLYYIVLITIFSKTINSLQDEEGKTTGIGVKLQSIIYKTVDLWKKCSVTMEYCYFPCQTII